MISKTLGLILLLGSLAVIYIFEGKALIGHAGSAWRVFHWPAMVLTGLGPFGLVLLSSEWCVIRRALKTMVKSSPQSLGRNQGTDEKLMQDLSKQYYSKGVAAFAGMGQKSSSPHFAKTLDRLSLKIPLPDARELLLRERESTDAALNRALSVTGLGLRLAPSVGMLGTIIGMVRLLAALEDPSQIGPKMSLALLTTFYGLFFSLVLWTPVNQRLEGIRELQWQGYERILQWLKILEERKPAQYFESPRLHQ